MAKITDGDREKIKKEPKPKVEVFRKVKGEIGKGEVLHDGKPLGKGAWEDDDSEPIITHSTRVRASDFSEPWFIERSKELAFGFPLVLHRKIWEFAVIAQVYQDRVAGGGRVLGFGCGKEPLPAYFAGQAASVVATDYPSDLWGKSNQQAANKQDLPYAGICNEGMMRDRIEFRPVDMRNIPLDLRSGGFDFVWSSSSMEHLGSLQAGIDFVCSAMECLRPGGIAVHTTEWAYNTPEYPKWQTERKRTSLESKDLSLYRSIHLREDLTGRLIAQGDYLLPLDFHFGVHPADSYVDPYPYNGSPEGWHLNLDIAGWKSTSVALVAIRGGV